MQAEQRRAEAKQKHSQLPQGKKWEEFMEVAHSDAVLVVRTDGCCRWLNHELRKLCGPTTHRLRCVVGVGLMYSLF